MAYQTFPGTRGDSNSSGKWAALKLQPAQIVDKDVLDLGCNEGFFCLKMAELGAKSVVGLDYSANYIQRAKSHLTPSHDNVITYRQEDWDKLNDYPDQSFDLILLLSAFHYSTSPDWFTPDGRHRLLDNVERILRPNGLLVLEVGLIEMAESSWIPVQRIADVVYHATRPAMLELLHKTFARVELKGPSVNQGGDPIPRHVFYCYKTKNTALSQSVILLTGNPGLGKSTLADLISEGSQVHNLSVDRALLTMKEWSRHEELRRIQVVPTRLKQTSLEISRSLAGRFAEDFVKCQVAPITQQVIVADGYTLGVPAIREQVVRQLHQAGYRVWDLTRVLAESYTDSLTPGYPAHALSCAKYQFRDQTVNTQSTGPTRDLISTSLSSVRGGLFVELGVLGGATLLHLYDLAVQNELQLVGVDPFEKISSYNGVPADQIDFMMKTKTEVQYLQDRLKLQQIIDQHRLGDRIELIQETSTAAAARFQDQSIDLLYLDGDHGCQAVSSDLATYHPKMKPGGLMLVSNSRWRSIATAVASFCANRGLSSTVVSDNFSIRC